MASHVGYAALSGSLVAASWAAVQPIPFLGLVPHVGFGFLAGVIVYLVIAVAHEYSA